MDKKKLMGLIIGIILFAALIVGATFAWLTYAINVTNGNYNVETSCFDVNYENGADISGTLNMVANPLMVEVQQYRLVLMKDVILLLKVKLN